MSSGFHVYRHHGSGALAILALILGVIVIFILIGATELAFQRIGFSRVAVIAILSATFLGSAVNLPLWRVKSVENLIRIEEVQFFWVTYRIPRIAAEVVSTTVAINLGGGIIPSLVSIYLLYRQPSLLTQTAIGVLATAVVSIWWRAKYLESESPRQHSSHPSQPPLPPTFWCPLLPPW